MKKEQNCIHLREDMYGLEDKILFGMSAGNGRFGASLSDSRNL